MEKNGKIILNVKTLMIVPVRSSKLWRCSWKILCF